MHDIVISYKGLGMHQHQMPILEHICLASPCQAASVSLCFQIPCPSWPGNAAKIPETPAHRLSQRVEHFIILCNPANTKDVLFHGKAGKSSSGRGSFLISSFYVSLRVAAGIFHGSSLYDVLLLYIIYRADDLPLHQVSVRKLSRFQSRAVYFNFLFGSFFQYSFLPILFVISMSEPPPPSHLQNLQPFPLAESSSTETPQSTHRQRQQQHLPPH